MVAVRQGKRFLPAGEIREAEVMAVVTEIEKGGLWEIFRR